MRTFAALALSLAPTLAAAQAPSPRALHDRVVGIIAAQSMGGLPAGDTSVSWRPDSPILYHTAYRDSSVIRTGMVRNDGVLGYLETRWNGTTVRSFAVRWSKHGEVRVDYTGTVSGSSLNIVKKQSVSAVAIPKMRWAIADISMEDQLVPILTSMSAGDSIRLAVFRPYGNLWDTVSVKAVAGGANRRYLVYQGVPTPLQIDLAPDGAILRIVRSADFERRPLETTRRFAQYQALIKK
jgi:hypothetical protein